MELTVNYIFYDECNGIGRLKPFERLELITDECSDGFTSVGFASPLACPLNHPYGFIDGRDIEEQGIYLYGSVMNCCKN